MSKKKSNKPSSSTTTEHSEEVLKLAGKIDESFKQLAEILEEAVELDYKLRAGEIVRNTPQFRYIDEMLTQCLLKLDRVETHGVTEVREYRRSVVVKVNGIAAVLDSIRDKT